MHESPPIDRRRFLSSISALSIAVVLVFSSTPLAMAADGEPFPPPTVVDSAYGSPQPPPTPRGSARAVLITIFDIVLGICQYYLPMAASVLWQFFGVATFLTDSLYLQYLYTTHLFVDEYASALLVTLHADLTGGACARAGGEEGGGCYCPEGQDLSTFFWVVFVVWLEFGFWPPPLFKSTILCVALVSYALSLVVAGTCSLSGMMFSIVVGAGLGIFKVYLYAAAFSSLASMLARRTILARALCEEEAEKQTAAATASSSSRRRRKTKRRIADEEEGDADGDDDSNGECVFVE